MSAPQFTPGPWVESHDKDGQYFEVKSGAEIVFSACSCCEGVNLFATASAERDANAALIAAAPDLYAALEIVSACGQPVRCSVGEPEDGVEGWRWTHPDGREWTLVASWDQWSPMHPLAFAALAKARGEVRS